MDPYSEFGPRELRYQGRGSFLGFARAGAARGSAAAMEQRQGRDELVRGNQVEAPVPVHVGRHHGACAIRDARPAQNHRLRIDD